MSEQKVQAPGAVLSYEVLGAGPVLALIGHPMPADGLRALAERLAADRTVVLHDPRGTGASTMTDPTEPPDPAVLADDLGRVLAEVTDGPADVFGTSGGAVTALQLAASAPDRVRTVVAHEPPLVEYLPDAAELRGTLAAVAGTYREQGLFPAMGGFMALVGAPAPPPGPPGAAAPQPSEADLRSMTRLLLGIESICTHRVDAAALPAGRVSIGLGVSTGEALTGRTSAALAAALDVPLVVFPGGHVGFVPEMGGDPDAFAAVLRTALG